MKTRERNTLIVGLILALLAVNHVEYYYRSRRNEAKAKAAGKPVIRAENGAAGHSMIGVDEASLGEAEFLQFGTLGEWEYGGKDSPSCPPSVLTLSGRAVSMIGFMYPLQAGSTVSVFCLLRSTQTCCYGPRPQYNQYVFVETEAPVKFERLAPVRVGGRFFVDPKPDEGYIYRMESASVRRAEGEDDPADLDQVARKTGLPVFDLSLLERIREHPGVESDEFKKLRSLEGKRMILQGFLAGRTKDGSPAVTVGKSFWDGKTIGTPPGLYNAALVVLRDEQNMPPVWWQQGVFAGTVRVITDRKEWPEKGIVSFLDAVTARRGAEMILDPGPFVPAAFETLLLAFCAVLGFKAILDNGKDQPRSSQPKLKVTP